MGILDDAIREHLDLKRQHGARESELREIEEDAFGGGEAPDPFASGELLHETAPPGGVGPDAAPGAPEEDATTLMEPRGTAEAPPAPPSQSPPAPSAPPERPPPPPEPEATAVDEPPAESQSLAELMAEEDPEPDPGAPGAAAEAPPAPPSEPLPSDEGLAPTATPPEPSRGEPEPPPPPVAEPPPPPVAEPPSAQDELAAPVEDEPAPPPPPPSSADVPDPPPPPPPGSEPPGRARGRVHHPTEEFAPAGAGPEPEPDTGDYGPPSSAPLEPEGTRIREPEPEAPPEPAAGDESLPPVYDFETDEAAADLPPAVEAEPAEPAADVDEFDDLGPPTDEAPVEAYPGEEEAPELDDEEPGPAPLEDTDDHLAAPDPAGGEVTESRPSESGDGEDLLAGEPEFLDEGEESEEDLWFEKGPPQDFDFDDEDR